jgi:ribosomal-protein-alanine N-acetyltransferase
LAESRRITKVHAGEECSVILTRRLFLRAFEPADLEPYAEIRSRPSVARFLPGREDGAKDAADKVRIGGTPWGRDAWNGGQYAPWAVTETNSSLLIGHLGLRFLVDIGETELLYMIDEPWWKKGLATEGGHAAVAFARDRLGLKRLVAFVLPENGASIAVLGKLGFRHDGVQLIFGLDTVRYVRTLTDSN